MGHILRWVGGGVDGGGDLGVVSTRLKGLGYILGLAYIGEDVDAVVGVHGGSGWGKWFSHGELYAMQLKFTDGSLPYLRWERRRIKEHFMSKVSQWSSPLHGTRPT